MKPVKVKAYQGRQCLASRDTVLLDLADRASWRVMLRDLLKTRGVTANADSRLTVTDLDGKWIGEVSGA